MGTETTVHKDGGSTGSHRTGNDVMGTGSHVGWEGKTADQWEKGIVGSGNRKSRGLGGGNRGPGGKRDHGLRTAEKRGLKVQSPILASGVVPGLQKKKNHVGKKII